MKEADAQKHEVEDTAKRRTREQRGLDRSLEETFPASDPVATGKATATEPPKARTDRKPPSITKEEIERAQRGAGQEDNS